MKLVKLLAALVVSLSLFGANALAQSDKAAKQDEIRKVTQTSLEKFYKAEPKLEAEVGKAPGYAVFTTYGLSFLVGGAGGKGLAHDNQSKKDTFMSMGEASAGMQVGIAESETLIIFKSEKGMKQFITSGWTLGGGGAVQAGAGGKSTGKSGGVMYEMGYYTLTKNGLEVGIAAKGTKFWKDKELN